MTEPTKPTPEQEALSRFLDELNKGQAPETDDAETQSLLETAALLRRAALPVAPPEQLTETIIRQACAQQETVRAASAPPQRGSRRWFYSGLIGTAASVLLAAGLHLSPVTAPITTPAVLPDTTRLSNETAARPSAPAAADKQPSTHLPANNGTPHPAVSAADTPKATPETAANPFFASNEASVPPLPSTAKNPQRTVSAPPTAVPNNAAAPIAERDAGASLKAAKYSVAAVLPPENPQALTLLVWPGHTPDSVNRDEKTGVITQRFDSHTPNEIVLTQSLTDSASPKSEEVTKNETVGLTTVVRLRFQQRITLTGRQSETELLAILNILQKNN